MKRHFRRWFSEFLGTFLLVFAGTGAIIVNDVFDGTITHLGIAVVFGLSVMVMIFAVGEISGAHFNPAVTFGFVLAKKITLLDGLLNIFGQVIGAFSASGLLRYFFPSHPTLGATIPAIDPMLAFLLEVILSYILMFVIKQIVAVPREKIAFAGVVIGSTISLSALFAGSLTGASMNPVRSIAPALLAGVSSNQWIYLTAPFLGAGLAIITSRFLHQD